MLKCRYYIGTRHFLTYIESITKKQETLKKVEKVAPLHIMRILSSFIVRDCALCAQSVKGN